MTDVADRLRKAREAAGFASASEAATRFGWSYPTYAGHENGHRGIKNEVLRSYARAFKVDAGWLLEGRTGTAAPDLPPGLGESSVAPLAPRNKPDAKTLEGIMAATTPRARHRSMMQCTRDYLAFGIRKGDFLVIGSPDGGPSTGVAVVNLVDETTAIGFTVLRQVMRTELVAPIGEQLANEDNMSKTIMGHILAVIRSPQIES